MSKQKSPEVHETALAYHKVSETYERGRPEYTPESVQTLVKCLGVKNTSQILDLGAGTGKFTKLLLQHCPHLIAVEPVSSMREILIQNLPTVDTVAGSAESIPAEDQSFDFVFVANAFHWFDAPKALVEIRRVLKKGGGLGLIWLNDGVFNSDWGKLIDQMLLPYESLAPQRKSGLWQKAFESGDLFSPLQELQLTHSREVTHHQVIDRVASLSFIAALPEAENQKFLAQVKQVLETHPLTSGRSVLTVDCTTDLYWSFKQK